MQFKAFGYVAILLGFVIFGEAIARPFQRRIARPLPTGSQSFTTLASTTLASTTLAQYRVPARSERIYLSQSGELLGVYVFVEGSLLSVDTAGGVSLVARDYTAELGYDYRGKLDRIGSAEIDYDYTGRIQQIGNTLISYSYRGRIAQIGNAEIAYTARGKVAQVGDVTIRYHRNLIDTISSNYTRSGTRIIIVNIG